MSTNRCKAVTADGTPCRAQRVHGAEYCFFHDPQRAEDRAAAQQAGGRKGRAAVLPAETPRRPVETAADVIALLGETIHQVRTGALDPRVGNCVGYLSGTILKAIQQGDMEERLKALETAMAGQGRSTDLFGTEPEELVIEEGEADEARACA